MATSDSFFSPAIAYGAAKLRSLGYSEPQIAGVLGSAYQESGVTTNAYNPRDPNGGSVGIMQWNGARLEALREWARKNNRDIFDHETQWDFVAHELETSENESARRLASANTAGEASDVWTRSYERPSRAGLRLEQRRGFADRIAGSLGLSVDSAAGENRSIEENGLLDLLGDGSDGSDGGSGSSGGGSGSSGGSSGISPAGGSNPNTISSGIFASDDNPISAGIGGILDPSSGGTFGQSLAGVGAMIGGFPGMALGSLAGGFLDSRRRKQDDRGGGFLDSVGDAIDNLFGVTTEGDSLNRSNRDGESSSDGGTRPQSDFTDAVTSAVDSISSSIDSGGSGGSKKSGDKA